ncbi:MAG TPA: hypothetical protein VHE12_05830 [bacterium]|nr:hypothetical protein [bacterium]
MTTAAQNNEMHTLLDWNLKRNPEGGELVIAELMHQNNQFTQIVPFREANDGVGHKVGVRTSLPQAHLSAYGLRHKASHSTTAVITEPTAFAVTWAKVNADLAELNGGDPAILSEAAPHAEALAQLVENAMVNGDHVTDPLEPVGLAIRHSSLSGEAGKVTIDGGGTTNLQSIYLVGMGPGAVYGIFPKGSKTAGIQSDYIGKVSDQNDDGELLVHKWRWSQKFGLAEEDHRFTQRIANISLSDLEAGTGTTKNLIYLMKKARARVQSRFRIKVGPQGINHYWLMSSKMFEYLLHQIDSAVSQGSGIRYENVDNGFLKNVTMPTFMGVPIIFSEQILDGTEELVS